MPGVATLMPLSAILRASGFGATSMRDFLGHVAPIDQLPQALGKIEHSFEEADLMASADLLVFALQNQIANGRINNHDLVGRHR